MEERKRAADQADAQLAATTADSRNFRDELLARIDRLMTEATLERTESRTVLNQALECIEVIQGEREDSRASCCFAW